MAEYMVPPIGAGNVSEVLAERSLRTVDPFPFAGMWLFTGAQGSGKTLLMMHLVKQIMQECPRCMIVSNMSIYGLPSIPYEGIDDFDTYNNGADGIIFVIDEIHTLFNSLESKGMPVSTMQVWCQNRKNRRLILGTTQRFNRVSKGIREQTTWNYECTRALFGFLYSFRVLDGSLYDDSGKYTEELPQRHFYVPSVSVMRMYNTLEVIRRGDNH